jgi:hypothetical protein
MSGFCRMAAAILLAVGLGAAAPEAARFETELGPTPINSTTRTSVTGHGSVHAILNGTRLEIEGTFEGMSSPATDAHLMMGEGIAIPGPSIQDLTVLPSATGTVTASLTLSRAQAAALRQGRLYIQINSRTAPAPGGNLWGWLLPEHIKAGQDEPLVGNWFLPLGVGLKAPSGRQS